MSVITIDTSQLVAGAATLKKMTERVEVTINKVLTANAIEIEEKAKQFAPVNDGYLRQSISARIQDRLKKTITVNAPYAAYIEFGTGKYAAAYVSSLPPDWQTFAAQYRGSGGGGTFFDFLVKIKAWVKKKGFGASYNVSTRRKNRQTNADIENIAYMISMSILKNGIHPHPFLYPAFAQQQPILIKDLEAALKTMK